MTKPGGEGFRHDIDGLRALAIVMVVAFHGALAGFSGGFAGVDVFFVISGYLIQTNLFRELDRDDTVRLGAFWARRVRRLAPAMALVVVTTLVVGVFVLSPLEWGDVAKDGVATSFYVSNIKFILSTTDYFHAGASGSYFLHTWSLGVEEQFYIVWPVLLVAVAWVTRRLGTVRARTRTTVLALLSLGSFALSVVLTSRGTPWAFFGLPTRAWEFGLAGLLVVAPPHPALERRAVQLVLGVGGLGCLVASLVVFDGATPYPGSAALLPVVGTLALLAVGRATSTSIVSKALSWRPLGWLGRHSYSWYLWHWPLILFAVIEWGDSTWVKALASFGALLPAMLTYKFVEQPVRFHRRLVHRVGVTFAMGAVLLLVSAGSAVAMDLTARHDIAGSSLLQRLQKASAERREIRLDGAGCPDVLTIGKDRSCEFGDVSPTHKGVVILSGDSHARHWVPALDQAAKDRQLMLVLRYRGACPAVELHLAGGAPNGQGPDTACYEYHRGTERVIAAVHPMAVIVSEVSNYSEIFDTHDQPLDAAAQHLAWSEAHVAYAEHLRGLGIPFGAVIDGPSFLENPARCVAKAGAFSPCEPSRSESTRAGQPLRDGVAAAARRVGAPTISALDLLCGPEVCPLEVDQIIVFSDKDHVTGTYARRLAPEFARFLAEVLHHG